MRATLVVFVIIAVVVAFLTFYIQPKDARPTSVALAPSQTFNIGISQ
ncbi:hypothetical protein [Alicyclobacillus pomorum]|jgi:hypothetical protein|nr:hypothetical protein [Alicyclobacillus pomorum]